MALHGSVVAGTAHSSARITIGLQQRARGIGPGIAVPRLEQARGLGHAPAFQMQESGSDVDVGLGIFVAEQGRQVAQQGVDGGRFVFSDRRQGDLSVAHGWLLAVFESTQGVWKTEAQGDTDASEASEHADQSPERDGYAAFLSAPNRGDVEGIRGSTAQRRSVAAGARRWWCRVLLLASSGSKRQRGL